MVERKNSWQLAGAAGLESPYRFRYLLGRGAWEADALRDGQRGEVLAGLGREDAVLAIDETGFIKQGKKSVGVGVARQYTGTSGKIDHCRIGVSLSWQTAKGHALIDRALYLPADWAQDQERRRAAGVPPGVAFATKPALARVMVKRVLAAGARPAWMGIAAFLETRVTNGVMEAINGLLQLAKRLARDLRSFRHFRLMALLKAGKPQPDLPAPSPNYSHFQND